MNRLLHHSTKSFRLLLYLEWVLLLIVVLIGILLPTPFSRLPKSPLLMILSIIAFGIMGLKLPQKLQRHKILYIAAEFALVLLATFGGGNRLFPILYLILVIRACLMFQATGRLIVTGVAFLLFLGTLGYLILNARIPTNFSEPITSWAIGFLLSFVLLFGLSLIFALLLTGAILSERQSHEQLAIANHQLRRYALRIEDQATLQERNRIAREIHDALGHSLTALNLQLETALKLWSLDPNQAQIFLAEAKKLGAKALQEVRQSVSVLRSNPLHQQSLESALESLVQDFHRTTGILPECHWQLPWLLPPELNTTVYRIVQEALTNICRHGDAKAVQIELFPSVSALKKLTLMIRDNGKGFQINQNKTGFGIQGMQERTLAQGGEFQISSQPGVGCQITVTFPLTGRIL
jgi:signal transduction histidine kinase